MAKINPDIPDNNQTDDSNQKEKARDIGSLFLQYNHLVFLVCVKYLKSEEESKDAVMEIFHKILTDPKEHEIINFPAWLHAVTKNHCLMKIRKAGKTKVLYLPPDEIDTFFVEHEHIFDHTDGDTIKWEELLNNLNNEQKTCIEMFYYHKKSYKEIAGTNGMNINEVKSHIQNGKRNLKNLLKKGAKKYA